MGELVLILGESGAGKSTSLRNFKKGEVGIFNVAGKRLPFKNDMAVANNATYSTILSTWKNDYKARAEGKGNGLKAYVIDDSQYLMAFDSFNKANEKGYGKFTDMAVNFYKLLQAAKGLTDDDTVVYFLHHTERNEDGHYKAKTLGKMLDNQLTLEGLFTIVLHAVANESSHTFITQSQGVGTAKSPMGMLPEEMDNDLKAVDTAIREYYNMAPLNKTAKKQVKENKNV